jgi:hypothetical protein
LKPFNWELWKYLHRLILITFPLFPVNIYILSVSSIVIFNGNTNESYNFSMEHQVNLWDRYWRVGQETSNQLGQRNLPNGGSLVAPKQIGDEERKKIDLSKAHDRKFTYSF